MVRWLCTSNPFYVLSAGLFLAGLYASFGASSHEVATWALMAGLGAYTLLLAGTACLLVRFSNVWDDVRTVLLLVVLMFLATSVTFDEVLVLDPGRGEVCSLAGLLFAVAVSEGLLRGTRLRLPSCFRTPYYLILALFFLYPLPLSSLARQPHSEALTWGLFGFSGAAGLVFLTLLPAVRRGPGCVRDNGSPWRWPLYPWTLFGLLGLAVPARAFLLCWSMHLLDVGDRDRVIFGPYFVVPFGLAVAVLLLEAALVSGRRVVLAAALAAPVGLVALTLAGHRPDPVYRGFLETFTTRLGGDPLFLTLLASAAFYAWAALRRARLAVEGLTAVLAALAFVGPGSLNEGFLLPPLPLPLLAAGLLHLALGMYRRSIPRCLAGSAGVVTAVALALPAEMDAAALRLLAAFHLGLAAVLLVGAAFDTRLGRVLRAAGATLVSVACLAALLGWPNGALGLPAWVSEVYVPALGCLLALYGLGLRHRLSLVLATLVLACWLALLAWRGYIALRQLVSGLDQIALGLALFGVAVLVSLVKAGLPLRLAARWRKEWPQAPQTE
jgi:hypothetical protein